MTARSGVDSIDLEPGWRLRVVTPILKSGGYRLRPLDQQTSGNTVTLSTGGEFLGYEVSYYAVGARNRAGVRVKFSSAEITREGRTDAQPRPLLRLFPVPHDFRYVRLIYLTRMSQADHDMAVATAGRRDALDRLTQQVLTSPNDACRSGSGIYCTWVPSGIAVVPEVRRMAGGIAQWLPAR